MPPPSPIPTPCRGCEGDGYGGPCAGCTVQWLREHKDTLPSDRTPPVCVSASTPAKCGGGEQLSAQ